MHDQPVCIFYNDLLKDDLRGLQPAVEQAFGNAGLGILVVKDIPPEFKRLRDTGLLKAYEFANLPEETREKYSDSSSSYSFGWSLGREKFNGKPDMLKGSYYAHPSKDVRASSAAIKGKYPEYYNDNIWPETDLPGYADAFKNLSAFMLQIGVKVAKLLDFVLNSNDTSIANMIASSSTSKARMLHYFPTPGQSIQFREEIAENDTIPEESDICADHLDHSLLTALCPAQYRLTMENGETFPIPCPSESAGLFIRPRGSKESVRVTFPADCLAFQTGEALQLLSQGKLAATPHRVTAGTLPKTPGRHLTDALPKNISGKGVVSRQTMAVFLQPDTDAQLTSNETFGQFTARILQSHY